MKNLTLVSQILNGGDDIAAQIEGRLYAKAEAIVEQVKLQQSAALLSEADPKPAVYRDHQGNPLIPPPDEWARYFEDLAASHTKAQLSAAKERWAGVQAAARTAEEKAEKVKSPEAKSAAKNAAAELKALGMELRIGQSALKAKLRKGNVLVKKQSKITNNRAKNVHGMVTKGVKAFKSPLLNGVVNHLATAALNHFQKRNAQKGGEAPKPMETK